MELEKAITAPLASYAIVTRNRFGDEHTPSILLRWDPGAPARHRQAFVYRLAAEIELASAHADWALIIERDHLTLRLAEGTAAESEQGRTTLEIAIRSLLDNSQISP